jgi:glycosyltransferase involved in cell wall biosynthesis
MLLAADILIRRYSNLSVDLIGARPDDIERLLPSALRQSGRVNVLPHLPRGQLAEHLTKLDVFVVPSHQEGLCIAALEAMSCGCPVVSTRCGGPQEFVIDDQTGYTVDFSASELADRIYRILSDRRLRQRLSAGAMAKVHTDYGHAQSREIFLRHFKAAFAAQTSQQPKSGRLLELPTTERGGMA